jgi:hypothetical protein
MVVAIATMMSVVLLVIFAVFKSFKDLMIQIIRLIDRVLSPYALLANIFASCGLFATLARAALILHVSVLVIIGRGSGE